MYLGKTGAVPKKGAVRKARENVDRRGEGLKECQIQKQCEDVLLIKGVKFIRIPDALYGLVFGGNKVPASLKALISAFIKGLPDLTLLFKSGRYVCVELKTTKGKESQGQKNFAKAIGLKNYRVVRSVEGLLEVLKEYGE